MSASAAPCTAAIAASAGCGSAATAISSRYARASAVRPVIWLEQLRPTESPPLALVPLVEQATSRAALSIPFDPLLKVVDLNRLALSERRFCVVEVGAELIDQLHDGRPVSVETSRDGLP